MLPLRDILSTPSPRNSPPPTSATSASTHAHAHAAQFRHAAEPHLATASNNNNNNYIASQDAQRVQSLLETASSYLEQGHNRPRAALAADQHPSHTHTHGHGNHHHHHGHHHHRLSLSETTVRLFFFLTFVPGATPRLRVGVGGRDPLFSPPPVPLENKAKSGRCGGGGQKCSARTRRHARTRQTDRPMDRPRRGDCVD